MVKRRKESQANNINFISIILFKESLR